MARIFHIATRADWLEATKIGTYSTSTLGRTLEEEGFIHASHREQMPGVFERYYAKAGEPLVLLSIDPARLEAEVREDAVGDDTFPHIYGPINRAAVVDVRPLNKRGGTEAFMSIMAREMAVRCGLAVLTMLLAYAGASVANKMSDAEWAPFLGAVAGIVVGAALTFVVLRRRA